MSLIISGNEVEFESHARIRNGKQFNAWWEATDYGTRPRAHEINLLVGHWTAGEAQTLDPDGAGPLTQYDDDGPVVVRSMKNRPSKKDPNKKLNCSIQFVIGACTPTATYAPIWQTMDIGLSSAVHVGQGDVNARSIGVEVVNCGAPGKTNVRNRPSMRLSVHNGSIEATYFYDGQLRSWEWLANALCVETHQPGSAMHEMLTRARINIPKRYPAQTSGTVYVKNFTPAQQTAYKGTQEHLHVPGTTKVDAGGLLMSRLALGGYEGHRV